uniref:Uncharacterized protein n=1 Tax=Anopheles minimus TaxID=112268 RepID=A0A182W533_9DIPT
MQFNSGNLSKIALVVAVCCLLLCCDPAEANPLPGKTNQAMKSKSKGSSSASSSKKADAPRHSLGTGARAGLIGTGVGGAILTSLI